MRPPSGRVNCSRISEGVMAMDWNRLLQGMGGRLLRQFLGTAMKHGLDRIGGPGKPKDQMTEAERQHHAKSAETQKRVKEVMRVGRRFWR